jgi:hypothetical protein
MESTVKMITMSRDQIMMSYAMVRVQEVCGHPKNPLHGEIRNKLHVAQHNLRGGVFILSFTADERKILREYNMNYCAILSDQVEHWQDEAVRAYRMATGIQLLLFSNY